LSGTSALVPAQSASFLVISQPLVERTLKGSAAIQTLDIFKSHPDAIGIFSLKWSSKSNRAPSGFSNLLKMKIISRSLIYALPDAH
jgi:hypothetical protein